MNPATIITNFNNSQLQTPPTSPVSFDKYYAYYNIQLEQSKLMPQPSKIKMVIHSLGQIYNLLLNPIN